MKALSGGIGIGPGTWRLFGVTLTLNPKTYNPTTSTICLASLARREDLLNCAELAQLLFQVASSKLSAPPDRKLSGSRSCCTRCSRPTTKPAAGPSYSSGPGSEFWVPQLSITRNLEEADVRVVRRLPYPNPVARTNSIQNPKPKPGNLFRSGVEEWGEPLCLPFFLSKLTQFRV